MPISRNRKLYFTDAQYKRAREYSALEYAIRAGYDLVKDGKSYYMRQHDSMIFTLDGRWFWNSHQVQGRALELLQYYEQLTLPEAVMRLVNGDYCSPVPSGSGKQPKHIPSSKPFELPERSPSFRRLFAYLCNTRKLDPDIVQELVRQKRIYECVRRYFSSGTKELRTAHNVVFVGLDEQGRPRSAFQRGTNTMTAYKRDVAGSQKKYGFCCPGQENVDTVAVFEAAIDAISHATLAKLQGEDWMARDRLALGGVSEAPLIYYLQTHPLVQRIELCLDNDAAGIKATEALIKALRSAGYDTDRGYTLFSSSPPSWGGKDWNEYLVGSVAKR